MTGLRNGSGDELGYVVNALKNQQLADRRNGVSSPATIRQLIEIIGIRVTQGHTGSPLAPAPRSEERVTVAPIAVRYETAAQMLEVSVSTIKRLVRAGRLPVVRVEKSPRIRVVDLEAYLAETGDHL